MRRKNIAYLTLVISALMIASAFSGIALNMKNTGTPPSLEVIKKVYDDDSDEWVNEIDAKIGDTVQFRINVTYHNVTDPNYPHYAWHIVVTDMLPLCLEYEIGSAEPFEPNLTSSVGTFVWDFDDTILHDGETITITFNASVIDCGENINVVKVQADEHCTGQTIGGTDSAMVNVPCPKPGINVEKKVWDSHDKEWTEEAYAKPGAEIRFNITVQNTGDCNLENVYVNDTLPSGLEYADDAIPNEPVVNGRNLSWFFSGGLEPDEKIYIEFNATLIDDIPNNIHVNWVVASGINETICPPQKVSDYDSAKVKVRGMIVEKEVQNKQGAWVEEIDAEVGDTVRFRIIIYYYGDHTLYNIHVVDELPECLEYADNATPKEPAINGQILTWDLGTALYDGQHTTIEFDALVVGDDCRNCTNLAKVWADECSGDNLYEEDSATIHVVCGLTADAGGPYYADIGETITIAGSAAGGVPPYAFEWDLDNDDIYGVDDDPDEPTTATFTYSWDAPGVYIIKLKVTDKNNNWYIDDTTVTVGGNNPPNKPSRPSGTTHGKAGNSYPYSTSTIDIDGDQIYYMWSWGDGTYSEWIGPYASGDLCNASHIWAAKNSYEVKVKAKDGFGDESNWSDPLPITMPKSRSVIRKTVMKTSLSIVSVKKTVASKMIAVKSL